MDHFSKKIMNLCFEHQSLNLSQNSSKNLHFHIKSWISLFLHWKSQISHNFLFTHEMMNFLCTIDLIEENLIKWWHFMHLFGVNWDRILHNSLPIWLDYSLIFASIFVGNFRNRGPRKRIDESNAPWTHLPLAWNLR